MNQLMRAAAVRRRRALERTIVRHLVRELKAAGFLPDQVWDSEEYVPATTERAVLKAVFAVDDATIHFDLGKGANAHSHGVYVVLGNGADCLSNWHTGDAEFDAVVERVSAWTRRFEAADRRINAELAF